MQLLPSSEHPLCGRLEEEAAQLAQALTPWSCCPLPDPPSGLYLLQAHTEIQGLLAVGERRLRAVGRVCVLAPGLQTRLLELFPPFFPPLIQSLTLNTSI